ncbi:MAG: hypothetical protein ACQERE_06220 [Pseudomonadota bacterium]
MRTWLSLLLAFVVFGSDGVRAETDLDVTMRMVPEDQPVSESVVRRIELPEGASAEARENARQGLERSEEASGAASEALDRARERAREGLERRRGGSGESPALQPPEQPPDGGQTGRDDPGPDRPDAGSPGQR